MGLSVWERDKRGLQRLGSGQTYLVVNPRQGNDLSLQKTARLKRNK